MLIWSVAGCAQLATSNLKLSDIEAVLNESGLYDCVHSANINADGLDPNYCPGATPAERLANLQTDGKMSYFKGYQHYFHPKMIGFDEHGMPVIIENEIVTTGNFGFNVVVPDDAIAYNPSTKKGYVACGDGRLRVYDFTQTGIPATTYDINVGTMLVLARIAGGYIYVVDANKQPYRCPTYGGQFEAIGSHLDGRISDIVYCSGKGTFAITDAGEISMYEEVYVEGEGWDRYFARLVNTDRDFVSITYNSSYMYAFESSDNNKRVSLAALSFPYTATWSDYDLFSNVSLLPDRAVTDGTYAYVLANSHVYKVDAAGVMDGYLAATYRTVMAGSNSVIMIEPLSPEIWYSTNNGNNFDIVVYSSYPYNIEWAWFY